MAFDLQTQLAKFLADLYAGILGATLPITNLRTGDGTVSAPAESYLSQSGLGFYRPAADQQVLASGGVNAVLLQDGIGVRVRAANGFAWSASTDATASSDTVISRNAVGVFGPSAGLAMGNTAALIVNTAPTVTSAGTSPSVTASNGSASFRVNVGTGGVATTIVLAMPAATTGWNAFAENITGSAANRADSRVVVQSSTTTSLTLQYQTVSTGAAKAFTASDIVEIIAFAF